jgi:ribosomal protein S18 acetylase RimI-like enzyme
LIEYRDTLAGVEEAQLRGFFVGWPHPPSPAHHLRMLHGSRHVWLALDGEQVVGFVNAISDGFMTAYIPLLEVLPAWQGRGIGTELMRRMLDSLRVYYNIDLMCDPDVQPFYARLGMRPVGGMVVRHDMSAIHQTTPAGE